MLALALLALASAPQDTAIPYGAEIYAPPVVRPYEPPSDFGRVTAEGDGEGDRTRRSIARPVAVESYRGNYEYAPSSAEAAYDRGVAAARSSMDARMGPLDGRWTVKDEQGQAVFRLVMSDRGPDKPLEGAWRADGDATRYGFIDAAERTDQSVTLSWEGGRLVLHPAADGWTGDLTEGGRTRMVSLSR